MLQIAQPADVFRAVGDPTRRAVLQRLREREYSMGDLADGYPGTQPSFSKHVKVLMDAGLVAQRRQGKQLMCSLKPEAFAELLEWTDLFRQLWLQKLDGLENFLEDKYGQNNTH